MTSESRCLLVSFIMSTNMMVTSLVLSFSWEGLQDTLIAGIILLNGPFYFDHFRSLNAAS